MEKVSMDTVCEWLLDKLENDLSKKQLLDLVVIRYIEDINNDEVVELYERIGGNLDGYKVVE